MNMVYLRLVAYVTAPGFILGGLVMVAQAIPAEWAQWVAYVPETQTLQVSLSGLAAAISGGLVVSLAVLERFGKK